MTMMSITKFKANRSKAFARAEAGELIEITRYGKIVAEMRGWEHRGLTKRTL
jgi:antitoxin (DNA-binding transcriptional repressor) of toxin-antitoxin stability system